MAKTRFHPFPRTRKPRRRRRCVNSIAKQRKCLESVGPLSCTSLGFPDGVKRTPSSPRRSPRPGLARRGRCFNARSNRQHHRFHPTKRTAPGGRVPWDSLLLRPHQGPDSRVTSPNATCSGRTEWGRHRDLRVSKRLDAASPPAGPSRRAPASARKFPVFFSQHRDPRLSFLRSSLCAHRLSVLHGTPDTSGPCRCPLIC